MLRQRGLEETKRYEAAEEEDVAASPGWAGPPRTNAALAAKALQARGERRRAPATDPAMLYPTASMDPALLAPPPPPGHDTHQHVRPPFDWGAGGPFEGIPDVIREQAGAAPEPSTADALAAEEAATPPADQVALTITWRGQFGADVSALVEIHGLTRGKWARLTSASFIDENGPDGDASQKPSITIMVPRHARYRVIVTPAATVPDDRYRKTTNHVRLREGEQAREVPIRLPVNRWNEKNVHDVWKDRDIDSQKADDMVAAKLLGHTVRVNRLVIPRIERTNAMLAALPPETQQEILDSIVKIGGYAKRTTSKGSYSNHSVGFALDINENMETKQNHHFYKADDMKLLLELVEPVVQVDSKLASFSIRWAKGMEQLEASKAFNRWFPAFLADLLDQEHLASLSALLGVFSLAEIPAQAIFTHISRQDLEKAIGTQQDATKKRQLQLVLMNWDSLRAWLIGVTLNGKKLVGLIPLHEEMLRIFLDAGWSWGGDWKDEKDYMHFEDHEALEQIKRS